jgi:hypothetical protein
LQVFLLGAFFSSKKFSKIWFSQVPPEITVRNEVLARIFSLGTLFLKDISSGTYFIARISTESFFS